MDAIEEVSKIVDLYINNENLLAKYYQLCLSIFPERAQILTEMSELKRNRANLFKKIKTSIAEFPQNWFKGDFDLFVITSFSNEIKSQFDEMITSSVNKDRVLSFLNDAENSRVEAEFHLAVKTNLPEFQRLFLKSIDEAKTFRSDLNDIFMTINK